MKSKSIFFLLVILIIFTTKIYASSMSVISSSSSNATWYSQTFTSSGTFTVPIGITLVYITAEGGGGSGMYIINFPIAVISGETITVTIGSSGNAGAANSSGSAGGSTSFGSYLSLAGGGGQNIGIGGAGGSGKLIVTWIK